MRAAPSCPTVAGRVARASPSEAQVRAIVLPPAHRLTDPDAFRRASRRGARAASRTLVTHLLLEETGGEAPARVGFVVSKAVGNAVTRNRVKRQLRHAARFHVEPSPDGRALPGSAVLVVRAPAGGGCGVVPGTAERPRPLLATGDDVKWLLVGLIRCYQFAISPLLGPTCRYYPSCSAYAVQAIQTHGALRGSWLAARRLGRCHPWSPGGVDHVPPRAAPRFSRARTATAGGPTSSNSDLGV